MWARNTQVYCTLIDKFLVHAVLQLVNCVLDMSQCSSALAHRLYETRQDAQVTD